MRYDGEDCPICHRIGTSEPIIKHREYSNPTNNRRGKNAGKFIGILVVIVVGLIAVPVGMMYLGNNTNPETPQGRAIELGSDNSITIDGKPVEIQPRELIPEDFTIFDDGVITYKMDPIPDRIKDKEIVLDGVYNGLIDWSQLNPKLVFSEISTGTPDIQISWINYSGTHSGAGCLDCLRYGATIDIALGQPDCNGQFVQYDKDMITETIAHEFGHNLGLEHNADESHLMWSDNRVQIPYDTLGYNIPKLTLGTFVGYKELDDKYGLLSKEIEVLGKELDLLNAKYNQFPEQSRSEEEYQRAMQVYNELNLTIDNYNKKVNQLNQLADKMNCFFGNNLSYLGDEGVFVKPSVKMIKD